MVTMADTGTIRQQLHGNISLLLMATVSIILVLPLLPTTESCEEVLCASLVSKCLLLKSCECNMVDQANCTCCKDCHRCLSKLYTECCDCVGMCPSRSQNSYKETLETASSIEELPDPIPALFSALTDEEDPEGRWSIYTYPAHLDLLYFKPRGSPDSTLDLNADLEATNPHPIRHGSHHLHPDPTATPSTAMNCTVAYHASCMSINKCKASCQSMGAARYRWFHQYGCCECIGSTCLHFGKGEALCTKCPQPEDEVEEEGGYYYSDYYSESEGADFYAEGVYKEENNYGFGGGGGPQEGTEGVKQALEGTHKSRHHNTGNKGGV